jgi:probable phosphoglycerate mutase
MVAVGQALGYEADRMKGAKAAMSKALGSNREPIYVMRHGRTALDAMKRSDGWLDFPLTDDGRRGIIPAQQYLKDIPKPLVCIYAPDLKRNMETAEIIQSGMGIDPADIDVADEIKTWNLGKQLVGGKKTPNRPIVKFYMQHPDKTPEGGESMNAFCKRFMCWFENMAAEKRAGPVLMVLSGSNIRELSKYLMGDRELLDLDEGGLLKLTYSGKSWTGKVILGGKLQDGEDPFLYGS